MNMRLTEYNGIKRIISRENLEQVVYYTNKLRDYQDEGQEVGSVKVPLAIYDDLLVAINMLLKIDFFNEEFINQIDFQIKNN